LCFAGDAGDLLKVLWYDGQGLCLFAKRLERGRFVWPSPADGRVVISPANWVCCSKALTGGCRGGRGSHSSQADPNPNWIGAATATNRLNPAV
jgi:hypothetical protein